MLKKFQVSLHFSFLGLSPIHKMNNSLRNSNILSAKESSRVNSAVKHNHTKSDVSELTSIFNFI